MPWLEQRISTYVQSTTTLQFFIKMAGLFVEFLVICDGISDHLLVLVLLSLLSTSELSPCPYFHIYIFRESNNVEENHTEWKLSNLKKPEIDWLPQRPDIRSRPVEQLLLLPSGQLPGTEQ